MMPTYFLLCTFTNIWYICISNPNYSDPVNFSTIITINSTYEYFESIPPAQLYGMPHTDHDAKVELQNILLIDFL